MVKDTDFLPKTEKKEGLVKIETGQFFDTETLKQIVALDEKSFPPGSAYEDAEDYYRDQLANESNINVIARSTDGNVIGYLLIKPQIGMVNELKEDDPEFVADSECAYVETMEIADEFRTTLRGGRIFKTMSDKAVEEGVRKNYKRFAMHARKLMGLNSAVKKYFGSRIIRTRDIPKWRWVADEPYEYIEASLKEGEK